MFPPTVYQCSYSLYFQQHLQLSNYKTVTIIVDMKSYLTLFWIHIPLVIMPIMCSYACWPGRNIYSDHLLSLNWVICIFISELQKLFIYSGYKSLKRYMIYKLIPPSLGCLFTSLNHEDLYKKTWLSSANYVHGMNWMEMEGRWEWLQKLRKWVPLWKSTYLWA